MLSACLLPDGPGVKKIAKADAGNHLEPMPPIVVILYFHKAIRLELERIHCNALAMDKGIEQDLESLVDRYQFLRAIYEHHSQAEDEVILPALDSRVKNVANSYSLEHIVENNLFNQMSQLLSKQNGSGSTTTDFWKEFISCTEAIQTTLCQHLFKEENQVLPLLMHYFSFEEQASLVWRFLCNIPVHLMERFLPWLASCLSGDECQQMVACMHDIVPAEDLVQQVFFEWLKEDSQITEGSKMGTNKPSKDISKTGDIEGKVSDAGLLPGRSSSRMSNKSLEVLRLPINDLLHWHKAIWRELNQIAEDTKKIHSEEATSSSVLKSLIERLQFLAKVWIFHSAAEDEFVFSVIDKRVEKQLPYIQDHALEDQPFRDTLHLLEAALTDSTAPFNCKISSQAELVLKIVENHFLHEEAEVLPLVCKLCSIEEQRNLLYESLRSMPLTFLERVLPWIVAVISDDEAKDMLLNIRLAAPQRDKALVALLSGWACKGQSHILNSLDYRGVPGNLDSFMESGKHCSISKSTRGKRSLSKADPCQESLGHAQHRPLKQHRNQVGLSNRSVGSGLFGWGRIKSAGVQSKPIDYIFQFHKAIRKDLEYLDVESARLVNCNSEFLGQFSGRFYFLWGLYRAHSNAEDNVVFPALEAKEALQNVSHSYMIDHKQEEQLFNDIAAVLSKFSSQQFKGDSQAKENSEQRSLAAKLQRMCKSVRICLDQHVAREELELWPLFDVHFTIKEQDILIGRIIGSTGAEVIQAMLPWVTAALTEEEQNTMMGTWQEATRNTMFQKWLSAWWKDAPSTAPETASELTPAAGTNESFQLLADYLANGEGTDKGPDSPIGDDKSEQDDNETFKPGWSEIFKLNQDELEAAVRKVSRDISLDPRRKAYLIQNLMTSRWMATQQKLLNQRVEDVSERFPSFHDEEKGILGCKHYRRNCKLRAACCGSLFTCRFCHDEASDHTMDRYQTKEMMCMKCLQIQPVGGNCITPSCNGYSMARYYCSICKFFNNDERSIYHCPFCNLCRVGTGLGVDYFHCMVCNGCMRTSLLENHVCMEKCVETNCPICFDFVFTSVPDVKGLPCGHLMHSACYLVYTSNHYTCPVCCKSLGDMTIYFGMLDALLAVEQLPEEYQDRKQNIFCNDCGLNGQAGFHWLYHKCSGCGSYNTRTV